MIRRIHFLLQLSLRFLASASLMFVALPWLMVLLILGTVTQRYIGLYASQKQFFGSFVLWARDVPLPGAYSILALIAMSLTARLVLKSKISRRRIGTLLVHVSAITLLTGGLISALMREEGYIVLGDGESAQMVSDYRQRELEFAMDGNIENASPLANLRAGEAYDFYGLPFKIHVLKICFPCHVVPRAIVSPDLRGSAVKLELAAAPYAKDDAQNLTGITFEITGAGGADGTYIAYEGFAPERVKVGASSYGITLKPVQRPLPFSVRLRHFTKSDYPGTEEARAYRSDVTVKDAGLEWSTAIEMNKPLRYKGYTLYQSSYVTEEGRLMSVLAVVKNAGEWFPYISIAMLCAGLLLHIFMLLYEGRTVKSA